MQRLVERELLDDVVRERDELRAVLRDLLEGRGLRLSASEVEGLSRAAKLLRADGCYECAFGLQQGRGHYHAAADRAAAYRFLLGPDSIDGWLRVDTGNTVRAAVLRFLDALVKAGAS